MDNTDSKKLSARVNELEAEVASLKKQLAGSSSGKHEEKGSMPKLGPKQYSAITLRRKENRVEVTNIVRNQVAAWINLVLAPTPPLEPERIMEQLSTGVMLCNLALAVSEKSVALLGKIHMNATSGSILAHENLMSFLKTVDALGVDARELFDPSCLVSSKQEHRNEREVVYSLLSFALVAHTRYGMPAPMLRGADIASDPMLAACLRSATQAAAAAGLTVDIIEAVGMADPPEKEASAVALGQKSTPSNKNSADGTSAGANAGSSGSSAAGSIQNATAESSSTTASSALASSDSSATATSGNNASVLSKETPQEKKTREADERRIAELTAKQEFFFLTALAVKMTHELREDVCVVSSEELWQKAIKEDIPFFKFHTFIENELTKAYIAAENKMRMDQAAALNAAAAGTTSNLRAHRERVLSNIQARQQGKLSLLDMPKKG